MTETDKKKFAEIMVGLAEIFNAEMSKTRLKLYFGALQDLNVDEFEAAANRIARELKFFPKPAEIREMALGQTRDRALQAWVTVEDTVQKHDYYDTVSFGDRAINAAICAGWGDWAKFCDDGREKEWVQKDFERLYMLYCGKPAVGMPDKVIGWHDKENSIKGYALQEPVMIGERTRVQIEERKDNK